MENNKHIEFTSEGGLKCDNPNCNYKNNTIKDDELINWIDILCPKCNENLLTKEDHERYLTLKLTVEWFNSLSDEELKIVNENCKVAISLEDIKKVDFFKNAEGLDNLKLNEMVKITVDTHTEIKATKVEKAGDENKKEDTK